MLGLILDETNMSPMFLLRLYAVIMASGNTFGNFSCRFEKWFLQNVDAFVAKPQCGTTNATVGESGYFLFRRLNRTVGKFWWG